MGVVCDLNGLNERWRFDLTESLTDVGPREVDLAQRGASMHMGDRDVAGWGGRTEATRPLAPENFVGSWDLAVSITFFFNLAIAQPLLDLVGRHAPFLIAHNATRSQIALMVLAITLLVPLGLAAIVLIIRRLHRGAAVAFHALLMTVLVAALAVKALATLPVTKNFNGVMLVLISVALGAGLARLFHAREGVRSFLRVGTPLPLLVAGLFLFASPASKLVFPRTVEGKNTGALAETPVVVLVFDELPVASLMTLEGNVDEHLFPNFARLAKDSTWFRNATTVDDATAHAVPPMLDGRYPVRGELPTFSDHPVNLFTLLGPTHRISALEPITGLCPISYCEQEEAEAKALVSDLWLLTEHILLPEDLKKGIPPLGDTWAGFGQPEGQPRAAGVGGQARARGLIHKFDRAAQAEQFIDSIRPEPVRSLYFMHLTIPHVPWHYLPSGQTYFVDEIPGKTDEGWLEDDWLVSMAYQRHLLQLQFADTVLGRITQKMKRFDLYDKAIVGVLADHGIWFESGKKQRDGAANSVGSVASVPLFVKKPFQDKPRVVDAPVQTIDLVPTMVDLLDIETSTRFDGRSLFSAELPKDRERKMPQEQVDIGPSGREKNAVVRAKYELLGAALRDPFLLAPSGLEGLINKKVNQVPSTTGAATSASLERARLYAKFDPHKPCPCFIKGTLSVAPPSPVDLAIAINGTVAAVTKTSVAVEGGPEPNAFYVLVSPDRFRSGANHLQAFIVHRDASGASLAPVPLAP